ncbi:Uncharacterized protein Rs2_34076 [Raphanus sativus]|nr:Uncharacterized protein Rs2_34076 [Raphanus sativus]
MRRSKRVLRFCNSSSSPIEQHRNSADSHQSIPFFTSINHFILNDFVSPPSFPPPLYTHILFFQQTTSGFSDIGKHIHPASHFVNLLQPSLLGRVEEETKGIVLIREKIDPVNKEFSTSQSVKLPPAAENPPADLEKKRNQCSVPVGAPPPRTIVRIKYSSVYHEINISPQASFGRGIT